MACKIFDPYPKDSRENFYDRENIIDEVEKLVSGKFWSLLIGPKRVGKTSIVKIVTKELNGNLYRRVWNFLIKRTSQLNLISSIDKVSDRLEVCENRG